MSKRRCTYCREYFDGSSMVVRGLSAFCSNAHLTLHASSSRPSSGPKAPRNRRNSMTEERRIEVLVLDHYRCRYCGDPSRDLAVHHISYRSEASNEPWLNQVHNLITLCNYPCHLDIVQVSQSFDATIRNIFINAVPRFHFFLANFKFQ